MSRIDAEVSRRSAQFDEHFGETADLAYVARPGGHADESTAVLSSPEPWADVSPAEAAEIVDDQQLSLADRIVAEQAAPYVERLLARLPAGCGHSAARHVEFGTTWHDGRLVNRTSARYMLSAFLPCRETVQVAFGSGDSWDEALANAMRCVDEIDAKARAYAAAAGILPATAA